MANLRRQQAMQSCAATYQTSPSLPSDKVGLTFKMFAHDGLGIVKISI